MRIYTDTSAFVKIYLVEPGTDQVQELLGKAQEILMSIVTGPEIISCFSRLKREGKLSELNYRQLKRDLSADLSHVALIEVSPEVLVEAIECLEKFALKTLDAIHLSSAILSQCDLFISSDQKQIQAAKKSGLKVKLV